MLVHAPLVLKIEVQKNREKWQGRGEYKKISKCITNVRILFQLTFIFPLKTLCTQDCNTEIIFTVDDGNIVFKVLDLIYVNIYSYIFYNYINIYLIHLYIYMKNINITNIYVNTYLIPG